MTAPVPGLTLTFDGGTDGAALATGGGIAAVSSPAPTYSAAAAIHGALGVAGTGTTSGPTATVNKPAGFTDANGSFTLSAYYRPHTLGGGAVQIASVQTSTNAVIGILRCNKNTGHFDIANGSGTALGASTLSWVADTAYRLDASYNGSTRVFTVKVFAGANVEGTTPDDTFTGTSPTVNPLDHILFSPSRSTTAGCVGYLDTIRLYDGVVTPDPFAPPASPALSGTLARTGTGTLALSGVSSQAGTVLHHWLGAPTLTGFRVKARTSNFTAARLAVSTSSGMTSPVYFTGSGPDADGYVDVSATGLTAGTRYYYQLEDHPVGGSATLTGSVGRAKTLPSGTTHKIALGSCITTGATDPSAMNDVVAWDPDVFLFVGDFDYSGDQSTSVAHQRATYENQITTAAGMTGLLRDVPWVYATSDHEAGPDNGDSNNAYTAANIGAYQQIVPTYPLADTRAPTVGRYHSFVVGRVRYIVVDIRNTDRSPGLGTDTSSKTMLGATQKAWLKDQLLQSEPVKVIVSDVAWMGAASTTNGEDKWWSYSTERQEISDYIAAHGVQVLFMHGDTHSLGTATKAKNTWGGFPVYCASPMHNTGGGRNLSTFSQTWSNGSSATRAYGRITVTDTGSAITFVFSGWDAATGVERITQTDVFTAPNLTGTLALSGSGSLSLVGRPGLVGALDLSGAGELVLTGPAPTAADTWLFTGPTTDVVIRIAGRGLHGVLPYGLTVWRSGGAWQQQMSPSPDQIADADHLYRGGRVYEITNAERDDLIAAGYGAYITVKESTP